jgi:hypothetical protein
MAVKDWHPVQLGIFWLLVVLFGFPMWLLLSLYASWVTGRIPHQDWFEVIPIVLAFVVVFAVVALGLSVTWKWLDTRQAKPQK